MKKPLLNNEYQFPVGVFSLNNGMKKLGVIFLMFIGLGQLSAQNLQIVGDSSVCPTQLADYSAANFGMGSTFTWSLPNGGGSIVGPANLPQVTIQWNLTPGKYTIRLVETTLGGNNVAYLGVQIEDNISVGCNNLVQVSVDGDCQAVITADMILEGPSYPDESYEVKVYDKNGKLVPNATVTGQHIGMTFNATVTHLCYGSTCWGRFTVEDKWVPELECTTDTVVCGDDVSPMSIGFPLDLTQATVIPVPNRPTYFNVLNWDKCGPIELHYIDQKQNKTCDDEFYSVIFRTWFAVDEWGNQTSCVDTIMIEKGNVNNVIFPANFDDIARPYLECEAKTPQDPGAHVFPWNALPNGNPSPYDFRDSSGTVIYFGTGLPSGTECDHLATTFQDVKIDVCGGTYKILRKWRVLDWCSGTVRTGDQLIKVIDNDAPIAICPPIDTTGTNYYTCTGTAKVLHPFVIEECSSWSYTVKHKPSDPNGQPDPNGATDKNVVLGQDGHYYINDLPAGRSWIVYLISDACGNTTECVTEIDVLDDDNPVAVCDEHTVVTLNEYGKAEIFASSVDQGSFDNCGLDSFSIRRMTTNCGNLADLEFGNKVGLCCEDVTNNPVMVVFRVWDLAGNYNDCMVEVTVQDKIAPQLECPPNITIDCALDYTDLDTTGRPIVLDECGTADLTYTDNLSNLNDCNIGFIIRRFKAEDESGRFSVCDQRITLVNRRPFGIRDITWPRNNVRVNGCSVLDADPSNAGRPTWNNRSCVKIAASYYDDVFTDVQDLCIKIVRTWTVIDWCQYDVNDPQNSAGKWSYLQTILVDNNVAPALDLCNDISVCSEGQNCSAEVELLQFGSDDCTAERDLIWAFEIDYNDDGTIDSLGNSNDATDIYPVGKHRIIWYATDECGNTGSCDQVFEVLDCKEPTPYCEPGIVTVIMPSTGEITIWASDFDAGSFDDCTPNNRLRFSFSSDTSDTGRTFDCDDLDGKMEMAFTVTIWVTDEAGNQDFCTTEVIIQANPTSCPNIKLPISITGRISTIYSKNCENVDVDLSKDLLPMLSVLTNGQGRYQALELEQGYAYRIQPHSNDDMLQNVSTADLVRIQKHILGIDPIKTGYGMIAADINNSGSISAKDLVALRKVILGIDQQFQNNVSWRFVDASHKFEDESHPWPFPEIIDLDTLTRDYDKADFYAVKVGDVTGNATFNGGTLQTRSNGQMTWQIDEQHHRYGETIEVPVYSSNLTPIEGAQFTLDLGKTFELVSIEAGQMTTSADQLGWIDPVNGLFTFVWFDAEKPAMNNQTPLFTLKLKALADGQLSRSLEINSRLIDALTVGEEGENELKLEFRNTKLNNNTPLLVGQNYPNPFGDWTVIPVSVTHAQEITISVFDLSGKQLFSRKLMADKGSNEIRINANDLSGRGILYYKVSTSNDSVTKKMILLD